MSDVVKAEGVVLYQLISNDYFPIGCAEEVIFRYKNEIVYKTSINSAGVREKIVRISDCSGSVNGLIKTTNVDSVVSIFWYLSQGVNRATGTFKFEYTDEAGDIRTIIMDAVVESVELRGSASDFGEFDLNFEGTGGFEMDIVSPPTEQSASQTDSATYTISGGNNYIEHVDLVGVTILEVCHEGIQFDKTVGSPTGRQFKYTSASGRIEFEAAICIDGQKVFVIWLY
jgi:hypothetical protein